MALLHVHLRFEAKCERQVTRPQSAWDFLGGSKLALKQLQNFSGKKQEKEEHLGGHLAVSSLLLAQN